MFKKLGIRFQLTFYFLTILTAFLVAFSLLLFRAFDNTYQEQFNATLYNFAVDIFDAVDVDTFGALSLSDEIQKEQRKYFPFPLGQAYVQIRTPAGISLLRSQNLGNLELPYTIEMNQELKERAVVFKTLTSKTFNPTVQGPIRMVTVVTKNSRWPTPLILQIAVPMTFYEQQRNSLLYFFAAAIPLFVIVGGIGGLLLSKRTMNPVKAIIEKAKNMGLGDLSQRLPVPEAHDELRFLTLTFNSLLERLEKAFASQDRFIANASHQLKTPLTILRGELDMLLNHKKSPEDVQAFLLSASQEINYLTKLVNDLLNLARVEAGSSALVLQPVALDDVLLTVVSKLEKVADQKHVRLHTKFTEGEASGEFPAVKGDEHLLRSLVENLVENAIKYSPENSDVNIILDFGDKDVSLTVANQGPPIDEKMKERIFERFFRSSESSVQHEKGFGLGLAIAKKIAEAHGSTIAIERNHRAENLFKFKMQALATV